MAKLLKINLFVPGDAPIDGTITRTPEESIFLAKATPYFTYIFVWENGEIWHEANLWIYTNLIKKIESKRHRATWRNNAKKLLKYMKFIELNKLNWWYIPQQKDERCHFKYLEHIEKLRYKAEIRESYADTLIAVVRRLYSWLAEKSLISPECRLWEEKVVTAIYHDNAGNPYSKEIVTTDFTIRSKRKISIDLEDGVLPVSPSTRKIVIDSAQKYCPIEIQLMLELGFFTGMRLGSICDLKISTIYSAIRVLGSEEFYYLEIGPHAKPEPVETKFGITGCVIIPTALLDKIKRYINSSRRLQREAKSKDYKNLVFLTNHGDKYKHDEDENTTVNTQMHILRKKCQVDGFNIDDFYFHRTRATFATSLTAAALKHSDLRSGGIVLNLVRRLLLHRNIDSAMKYVNFIEEGDLISNFSDEYTRKFLGTVADDNHSDA